MVFKLKPVLLREKGPRAQWNVYLPACCRKNVSHSKVFKPIYTLTWRKLFKKSSQCEEFVNLIQFCGTVTCGTWLKLSVENQESEGKKERDNQKIPQKVQSCSDNLPVMGWAFCWVTSHKNQRLLNFDSHEKAPCLTDQDIENDNVALYGIISNLVSMGQCLKLTNQIALLLVQYFPSIRLRSVLHDSVWLSCIYLASHNFLYLPIFFSFFPLKMLWMKEHYFGSVIRMACLKFTTPFKFEFHTVSYGPSFPP